MAGVALTPIRFVALRTSGNSGRFEQINTSESPALTPRRKELHVRTFATGQQIALDVRRLHGQVASDLRFLDRLLLRHLRLGNRLLAEDLRFLGLPVNRMTGHLFQDLKPFAEDDVALHGDDCSEALASILRTKCQLAKGDPGNTGEIGDIYTLPPNLWLVRNEVGGWTAMYPEDY